MKGLIDSVRAELFEIVLPQALYFAHGKENVIAIWWYEKATGKLLSDTNAWHAHDDELYFGDFETKNNNNWLRGRLIRHEEKVYLIIYLQLGSTHWNATQDQINDVAKYLTDKHNVKIDFIVDQDGHNLLTERKI